MSNLPAKVPGTALSALLESIGAAGALESEVELRIGVSPRGLNARELAGFLNLIDGAYGRITAKSQYVYARDRDGQIKVEIRSGSVWLVIGATAGAGGASVVLIWLLLKYLPIALEKSGQFAYDITAAYNNIEQGRLARAKRQEIEKQRREASFSQETRARVRDLLRREGALADLDSERIRQVARLIDAIYGLEEHELPKSLRFIDHYVEQLVLRAGDLEHRDPPMRSDSANRTPGE